MILGVKKLKLRFIKQAGFNPVIFAFALLRTARPTSQNSVLATKTTVF